MRIKGKFVKYQKLGDLLAQKICLGWKPTTEISDRFGNGRIIFKHNEYCTAIIPFTEIKVEDIVMIEFQKLGEIKKLYKYS